MRHALFACCLLAACTADEQNLGLTTGSGGASSAVGSPRWAVAIGGAYNDRGMSTAIDSIGDVVAVGDEAGPQDSRGLAPTSSFVTKRVASDGSERWTAQFVPAAIDSYVDALSVAITADDSILVTGSYLGTVDFDGVTLSTMPGRNDTFIAKYTWDGHLQWLRGLDPAAASWGAVVATDSAGRIVVAGAFADGTLTFGADSYTVDNDPDAFVAVFDPSGTLVWGRAVHSSGGPYSETITVASNDDVIVGGDFNAPASFGGATLDPGGLERGFVARYRSDGLFLSSQMIGAGAPAVSWVTQVAASPAGLVVRTIETDGPQSVAHPPFGMVRMLDDGGQELWSRPAADGNINHVGTLAVAPSGLIVSSAWDDNVHHAVGTMDVVSYDPAGHASTMSFGSQQPPPYTATAASGSAVGLTGAIAYAGEFSGQLDFGSSRLAAHGQNNTDAYIVLVDPPM